MNKLKNIFHKKKEIKKITYKDITIDNLKAEIHRVKYKNSFSRLLRSTVYVLIIIVAISSICATLFMPVIEITDSSMKPLLNDGDIVLTVKDNKFKTGDIVAFYHGNKILIKRVIGVESDFVNIDKDGIVYVNGKERTQLTGAEFRLYDAKTGGNEIKVVLVDATSNTYRVARANENGVTIKAGKATILGLDAGKYYLEEVVAPTGYNKLTSRVEIIISKINSDKTFSRFSTNVENYTGSKLPETGGIGTTLFLTLGSILVIGFGLLLVTKLRVYKENI